MVNNIDWGCWNAGLFEGRKTELNKVNTHLKMRRIATMQLFEFCEIFLIGWLVIGKTPYLLPSPNRDRKGIGFELNSG